MKHQEPTKREFFESRLHSERRFRRRNRHYHRELRRFYRFHVPRGRSVLELGCGCGDLLAALEPSRGVGVDFSAPHVETARKRHPDLEFHRADAAALPPLGEPFDFIILSDLLESLDDVQNLLSTLHPYCHPATRILVNSFNNLWEPLLLLGERLGLKNPAPLPNWISPPDVRNLFYLAGFDTISQGHRLLLPWRLPLLEPLMNRFLAKLPGLRQLGLVQYLVARPAPQAPENWRNAYSVSILIPTRDEAGNIAGCFERTPKLGKWTELIFVDGNSTDGTVEAIERGIAEHGHEWQRCLLVHQGQGRGKGDAVRQGFDAARGDILMILDSDLTMPPEDLPKYYEAIATGRGEMINGCRLVYPMEDEAMRLINYFGNKTFSLLFTWLLEQRIKDTLCGTKVLWREDYLRIAANRHYFGDFDPFGDFDLLFGAAKLDRKIVDLPIRYRNRLYGDIKIERWKHAMLLFRMCWVALRRMKLQ